MPRWRGAQSRWRWRWRWWWTACRRSDTAGLSPATAPSSTSATTLWCCSPLPRTSSQPPRRPPRPPASPATTTPCSLFLTMPWSMLLNMFCQNNLMERSQLILISDATLISAFSKMSYLSNTFKKMPSEKCWRLKYLIPLSRIWFRYELTMNYASSV